MSSSQPVVLNYSVSSPRSHLDLLQPIPGRACVLVQVFNSSSGPLYGTSNSPDAARERELVGKATRTIFTQLGMTISFSYPLCGMKCSRLWLLSLACACAYRPL